MDKNWVRAPHLGKSWRVRHRCNIESEVGTRATSWNHLWNCRTFFRKSPMRSSSLYASTQKVLRPSYTLILQTYSKLARKIKFLAFSVCFPKPCSSAGRMFAASRSHLHYIFVSTTTNSTKCLPNWIPLRIRVCSTSEIPNQVRILHPQGEIHNKSGPLRENLTGTEHDKLSSFWYYTFKPE